MSSRETSRIIQSAYGRQYHLTDFEMTRMQMVTSQLRAMIIVLKQRWIRYSTLIALLAFIGGSIYSYNLLISIQQDCLASQGKINALLQQRHNLSLNLSKAVFNYAQHEREVLTSIVAMRTLVSEDKAEAARFDQIIAQLKGQQAELMNLVKTQKASPNGDQPATASLSGLSPLLNLPPMEKLLAVAEQYPDLKLSATFINLMNALVAAEGALAAERVKYNDYINIYSTDLAQFPINVYGKIFGFKDLSYFEATPEAQQMKPIAY